MPADNIDRAIKKGTGELPGVSYEEVHYEGYGPSGAAIYIHSLTDNKNRTAADIRSIFAKNGGNMAGAGSVSWLFEMKGLITVDASGVSEDTLLDIVLNAGAEDMKKEGDTFEIVTQAPQFEMDKHVADKPIFQESSNYGAIKLMLEDPTSVMVAHNARFDQAIIEKEGITPSNVICTLRVARALDKNNTIPQYKLQYLRYYLDIDIEAEAHDALGDVLVLEQLFKRLLTKIMKEDNLSEVES
jgi:hypothetical protein